MRNPDSHEVKHGCKKIRQWKEKEDMTFEKQLRKHKRKASLIKKALSLQNK